MTNNYLCKCGHLQESHDEKANCCWPCLGEYINDQVNNKRTKTLCARFKLDNLSYLEQKYNQKILEQYKVIKEI
jgi:hypothetical protein